MLALRFLRLAAPERRLLLRAALLVVLVRLGLWVAPFRSLQRALDRWARGRSRRAEFPGARIAWAVEAASRRIPQATCLVRALAAHALLTRAGYAPALRIGVTKEPSGKFEAHAWLELDGKIVIGGEERARFVALPDSGGAA